MFGTRPVNAGGTILAVFSQAAVPARESVENRQPGRASQRFVQAFYISPRTDARLLIETPPKENALAPLESLYSSKFFDDIRSFNHRASRRHHSHISVTQQGTQYSLFKEINQIAKLLLAPGARRFVIPPVPEFTTPVQDVT